ncbi:MAG TPA: hypothetical protein VF183_02610 [Acidimicrobiales bacterium]
MDEDPVNAGGTAVRGEVNLNHAPPSQPGEQDEIDLREGRAYYGYGYDMMVPRRQRSGRVYALIALVSVVIIAASTIGAYLFVDRGEETYGARAEIRFDLGAGATTQAQIDRLIASQTVVAESRAVLEPAAAATGTPIDELESAFKAEIVGSSSILRLTVESPDPDKALRLVQAVADSYIAEVQRTSITDAEEFLQAQIKEATDELTAITERLLVLENERAATVLAGAQVTTEEELLRLRSETLNSRLSILQERLIDVQLHQREVPNAVLVGSPYVPDEPVGMKASQAAAFGALIGIVIAASLGVAIWQLSEPR